MTDERRPERLSRDEFVAKHYFHEADKGVLRSAISRANEALSAEVAANKDRFTWSGAYVGFVCDHIIKNAKLKPASNLIC